MKKEEIKKEILDIIIQKYKDSLDLENIKNKIISELSIMEETIGLDNKNNLENFYSIWKSNVGKIGNKNDINSWTAFYLGITQKEPSGNFIPDRRVFARAGFPDIDTDFDYENRDKVYRYIIDKYGRENVGNIGTHGLLKFKSCVRRVGKALDIADAYFKGKDEYVTRNEEMVSQILESFPKMGPMKVKDEEGNSHLVKNFEDAFKYSPDFRKWMEKFPLVAKHCRTIEDVYANFGSHASGIVLSNVPLEQIAPLRTAKGETIATQYPSEDLELLGLIKFDILAISTLSVIKKTVQMVKDNWGINIPIENLPLDDNKTFELYRTGNLGGVFQCENYGMQKTMIEMGVDRFEDIVVGIALYRPGPMDNIQEYCARKKGEKRIDYFDPIIEKYVKPYLEETYAIAPFQEQIMQICNSLAGFSIADGYSMIKAIGKKKEDLLKQYEKQFVNGCCEKGVKREVAQNYWDKFITPFASYGFNRSHSVAYALNSYSTAYLKANYPDEFICSLLDVTMNSSSGNRYDKALAFEKEFQKKMHIKILPRDVNKCKTVYTIERRKDIKKGIMVTEIRPSLMFKGISLEAAINIEKNQPFSDLKDFVQKTDSSIVDARNFESLLENGYFGRKAKDNKIQKQKEFLTLRADSKKIAKKGVESGDIFS